MIGAARRGVTTAHLRHCVALFFAGPFLVQGCARSDFREIIEYPTVDCENVDCSDLAYPPCATQTILVVGYLAVITPVTAGVGPFRVSPTLPRGLRLDAITAAISGTPSNAVAPSDYTISSSTGSTTINIQVAPGFVVDDLTDADDATPGDGKCASASATCTLRAALEEANAGGLPMAVAVPAGTITLSLGALAIAGPVWVSGSCGGATVVDGDGASGVFSATGTGAFTLANMTVQNGALVDDAGAGVAVYGMSNPIHATLRRLVVQHNVIIGTITTGFRDGGGIHVYGANAQASISDCVVLANTASGRGGGVSIEGGAAATISRTAIVGNTATGYGGGLNADGGSCTVTESLFAGNTSDDYGGAVMAAGATGAIALANTTLTGNVGLRGGAIAGLGASITLLNDTIVGNRSTDTLVSLPGGIYAPSVSMQNVILQGNVDASGSLANCFPATPAMASLGSNIADDASDCGMTAAGDQPGVSAILGPLQDNGGPTETTALLPGSPGIDQGHGCPALDQRGYPRPTDSCDVGAFEVQ